MALKLLAYGASASAFQDYFQMGETTAQYEGKEEKPTLVMEAFCDYNLWIWHATSGFPGTYNDINIWDHSPLLESFLDGSFAREVDFDYNVGSTTFRSLFLLVDGIYPEHSRFVKTLDEAVGHSQQQYASWQESSRKDIERAFGVLKRKFQILVRPFELWFVKDIACIVKTMVMLHNMMVEQRISRDEPENSDWYEYSASLEQDDNQMDVDVDPDEEFVQRRNAEILLQRQMENQYY